MRSLFLRFKVLSGITLGILLFFASLIALSSLSRDENGLQKVQASATIIDGCVERDAITNDLIRRICHKLENYNPQLAPEDQRNSAVVEVFGQNYILENHTERILHIPFRTEKEWLSFKDSTKPAGALAESTRVREKIASDLGITFDPNADYPLQEDSRLLHDPAQGKVGITICEVGVDCEGEAPNTGFCWSNSGHMYGELCWYPVNDDSDQLAEEYELQWFEVFNNGGTASYSWKPYGLLTIDAAASPSFDENALLTNRLIFGGLQGQFIVDSSFDEQLHDDHSLSSIQFGAAKRVRAVNSTTGFEGSWAYATKARPENIVPAALVSASFSPMTVTASANPGQASISWTRWLTENRNTPDNATLFSYNLYRCHHAQDSPTNSCTVPGVTGTSNAVTGDLIVENRSVEGSYTDTPATTGYYQYCIQVSNMADVFRADAGAQDLTASERNAMACSETVHVITAAGNGGSGSESEDGGNGGG